MDRATRGSYNVFADLDLPNPEELLVKASCVSLVIDALKRRKLGRTRAARLLETSPTEITNIFQGHLSQIRLEDLFAHLRRLGFDIDVRVSQKPERRKRARTTIIRDL